MLFIIRFYSIIYIFSNDKSNQMNGLNPRNNRAEAESMYISVINDTEATMQEVQETINTLLMISK